MALLTQKEINSLRDGEWETHCVSMGLAREDGQRSFSGSGSIRQDERGRLTFTLYDSVYQDGIKDFSDDIQGGSSPKAGEFYPKGHYYILTTTNKWGRQWVSTPTVDIYCDYGCGEGAVVTGTIQEMTIDDDLSATMAKLAAHTEEEPEPANIKLALHFYFFDDFKYPCNTVTRKVTTIGKEEGLTSSTFNVARFDVGEYDCEITNDNGIIHFIAKSKEPMTACPANLDLRLQESFQFVVGRPIQWQALRVGFGNTEILRIRSKRNLPIVKVAVPPLAFQDPRKGDAVWLLFSRYFSFVLPCSKPEWHPVSSRLFTIQHGRSYLWNVRMLIAGVEIEGLLNDYYDKRVPPPENIKKSVDEAIRLLKESCAQDDTSIDEASLKRMASSLGLLKSKGSAHNRLKKLLRDGVVRSNDVDAWKFVRDKAAHAVRAECEPTPENLDRINRLMVLFYHLVFDLIGHQGEYTDYGTRGFPERCYPEL